MEQHGQRGTTDRQPGHSMPAWTPDSSQAGTLPVTGPANVLAEPVFGATRQTIRRAHAGSAVHEET